MSTGEKAIYITEVKIRPLVTSDIASTLNIYWAQIPEKDILASQLGGRLDLSLIAEYQGYLAGFLLGRLIYAGMPMVGLGVIFFAAVNPNYRGHGIGAMLLETFKANCRAQGIKTVRALVQESDSRTRRFFEKAGFYRSDILNFDCVV
jgi:ribosomal protein S18 acetylase RimI-like enzyme